MCVRAIRLRREMSADDPKAAIDGPMGLLLLTGPFQMMWLETDPEILAMFGYAGRDYECSEEPTPRLNKFGQDQ
jgi:hypothetical protein